MTKKGTKLTLDNKWWHVRSILYAILLLSLAGCKVLIGTIEIGVEDDGDSSVLEATATQSSVNEPTITLQKVPTTVSPTDVPDGPDPTDSPILDDESILKGLVYAQEDFLWKIGADGEPAPFIDITNNVTFSPDGLSAVFGFPRQPDLWIADTRSGERNQLTDNPDRAHFNPQWWPGSTGAILMLSAPFTPGQAPGLGNLTLIYQDGTGYQVLESEFKSLVQPSPSPNGRTIAYVRGDESAFQGGASSPWLFRLDSGPEPFLYTEYRLPEFTDLSFGVPAYSPNGRYLAWVIGGDLTGDGSWQLGVALFDLETMAADVLLAHTPGNDIVAGGAVLGFEAPRWSANSRWFTWSGFPTGSEPGTWIMHRDGSEIQFVENAFAARWSPDSRSVAFLQGPPGEPPQVRVMEVASGEVQDTGIPTGTMLMGWVSDAFAPTANVPEGVWTEPGIFGPIENELLVQRGGRLGPEEVPTYMEIVWDYSPASGRLAYSSRFFHFSEENPASVTDLWVYDYNTGQAERWLEDNLTWASWRPPAEGGTGSDRLTAALYDPERGHLFLAFVDGPNEIEIIADCASTAYAWSPDSRELAYVNKANQEGVSEVCTGTFIYSAEDGSTRRASDLGDEVLLSGAFDDAPIWAVDDGVLFYPDQPLWVVPLDGSPPFVPQAADGEEPMNLPRMQQHLWAPEYNLLLGNVEAMMDDFSGVWVFELSDDLGTIIDRYRIEDVSDFSRAYRLIGWWEPGESLLMLTAPNEFSRWGIPFAWSLSERTVEVLSE